MPEAPAFDVFPVTIRGPLVDNSSGVVTFARVFNHDGRMYIAQSPDKGKTIRSVHSYEIAPDIDFVRRGSKTASFNGFKWSGCGCSSKWGTWTTAQLAAMDQTPAESADA